MLDAAFALGFAFTMVSSIRTVDTFLSRRAAAGVS